MFYVIFIWLWLPSAVAIDNTIVISPGERGALTAVVVVGGVVGVVVIRRVVGVVVIGGIAAHVVIGGIVIVIIGRIVAVISSPTKEES